MPHDPSRVFLVSDIRDVSISEDASEGAMIGLKVREGVDVEIWMSAETLAKLQAMLTRADIEHAKLQPKQ